MTGNPFVSFCSSVFGKTPGGVAGDDGGGEAAIACFSVMGADAGRWTGFGRKFAPDTGTRMRFWAGFSADVSQESRERL
jgi:hypothetical protein